ncbi:MAG: 50S ribosomal protein L3 N(5)-glutamine methyltransferase [Cardiobacteriaceae bacterium]|nr:50S ribosomal protein L3 N(5)-glutamine methyltransferase [Cardiobacteriaceae bacterium]
MQHLATILDWIRYATSTLARSNVYFGHGTDNPLDEAAALVLGLLGLPFDLSPTYFAAHLTLDEREQLSQALQKRIESRIPVPYLTNRTLYGGYEFYVDERVLIPRSPIIELIERDFSPWWKTALPPQRILDLCCGSGCLGILAQLRQPQAEVVLTDIDTGALEVAQYNLSKFAMDDDALLLQGDLFTPVQGQFDWIICNPPYVEAEEMTEIAQEFLHEPQLALVSGTDGLDASRRILAEALDYLTPRGILVLEVGTNWPILQEAFPDADFEWVEFKRGGEGVCVISADELLAWREAGIV